MVRKKKAIAGPGKAGYQSFIKLWPMVEHAKTAQSGRTA
jgi:hypothetical protein